jgi:hypothetical protein
MPPSVLVAALPALLDFGAFLIVRVDRQQGEIPRTRSPCRPLLWSECDGRLSDDDCGSKSALLRWITSRERNAKAATYEVKASRRAISRREGGTKGHLTKRKFDAAFLSACLRRKRCDAFFDGQDVDILPVRIVVSLHCQGPSGGKLRKKAKYGQQDTSSSLHFLHLHRCLHDRVAGWAQHAELKTHRRLSGHGICQ